VGSCPGTNLIRSASATPQHHGQGASGASLVALHSGALAETPTTGAAQGALSSAAMAVAHLPRSRGRLRRAATAWQAGVVAKRRATGAGASWDHLGPCREGWGPVWCKGGAPDPSGSASPPTAERTAACAQAARRKQGHLRAPQRWQSAA